MIVQIYGLTQERDVRALVEAGVDHLGFAVEVPPADISISKAQEFVDIVPAGQKSTVLTTSPAVETIVNKVRAVEPDIVHICSSTYAVGVEDVREIREALSFDVEIEKSIEVSVEDPVAAAREFADVSDYLLLDSPSDDEDIPGVGVTGETHDWSISARVVDAVETPVILAGGLSPKNVGDAIRTVKPAGVDSYTQTSRTMREKDIEATRSFTEAARSAASLTEST